MAKQMTEFEEGDIVVLKSGGPKMTVKWCTKEQTEVVWFKHEEADYHTEAIFNTKTLELA